MFTMFLISVTIITFTIIVKATFKFNETNHNINRTGKEARRSNNSNNNNSNNNNNDSNDRNNSNTSNTNNTNNDSNSNDDNNDIRNHDNRRPEGGALGGGGRPARVQAGGLLL